MRNYYGTLIVVLGLLGVFCAGFLMKKRRTAARAMFVFGGILFVLVGMVLLLGFGTLASGQD
jgi:protein-S-isoprenylcysteine O-methyltransferase Ste14